MEIISTEALSDFQKSEIFKLWNNEYPVKISYSNPHEFEGYLNTLIKAKHYLLVDNQSVLGWSVTFLRDNQIWFAIILDSQFQSKGYGTLMLNNLKSSFNELNGWVIDHNNDCKLDGSIYISPLPFYLKNGFQVVNDLRIENEKISAVKIVWRKND